jgi:hypothetical protein
MNNYSATNNIEGLKTSLILAKPYQTQCFTFYPSYSLALPRNGSTIENTLRRPRLTSATKDPKALHSISANLCTYLCQCETYVWRQGEAYAWMPTQSCRVRCALNSIVETTTLTLVIRKNASLYAESWTELGSSNRALTRRTPYKTMCPQILGRATLRRYRYAEMGDLETV